MSPHAWHTAALLRPRQLRTPPPMKKPADAAAVQLRGDSLRQPISPQRMCELNAAGGGGGGDGGGGNVFPDAEEEAEFWRLLEPAPEPMGPADESDDGWLAVARRLRLRQKTAKGWVSGRPTQEEEGSEVTLPQVAGKDPDGSRSAQGQSTSEDTKGKGTSKGSGKTDADDGPDDRPVITPMWSRGGDDSRFWKNVEGKDNLENGQ